MDINEITALAKAGFTKADILAMVNVSMQGTAPVQASAPTQSTAPVQASAPVQVFTPIQEAAPVDAMNQVLSQMSAYNIYNSVMPSPAAIPGVDMETARIIDPTFGKDVTTNA